MKAVSHLEKVIVGEASAVTHLEKVIAGEVSAVTYTEKVITGEAPPITHLQKVIAGEASPVTHLEHVWAGRTPEPTEHEYTGAVPVTIIADGTPLLDCLISGNTVQSGTPTPENPIMPQGTGEKTGNLWNEDYTGIDEKLKYVPVFVGEGTFTLSTNTPNCSGNAPLFLLSGNVTSGASTPVNGVYNGLSRTTDSSNGYITIAFRRQSESSNPTTHKTMLNTGSTALPYEPYGYKIPISSANTTTPIYLGEVETTRKIKKLVFDGSEPWVLNSNIIYINNTDTERLSPLMCTHFPNVQNTGIWNGNNWIFQVNISNLGMTGRDEWIAFLQQQYSAGHPVTVWYVPATPTTGIVNEPLMKIGEYADTLSMEQAGVNIPTLNGQTVVDVDTTLKPSEVYIKYKG